MNVTVIVLAMLSAAATAALPALRGPDPYIEAPAYPGLDGELGSALQQIQAMTAVGFTTEASTEISSATTAAQAAAANGDFDGASTALDAAEVSLAFAALEDHVTGDRYDAVKAAIVAARAEIGPAKDAAAAAAAEAERQRAAAEEAERQRLEEIARQAEAERQAELEREAAEQQYGFGQTLDDLGQSIRDRFDQWFSGN